jgi:serine/threonine protein kinase
MGEVYRAREASLKRDVAVNVPLASSSQDSRRARRFQTEAQSAASLNHPNVVSISYIGYHDGSLRAFTRHWLDAALLMLSTGLKLLNTELT